MISPCKTFQDHNKQNSFSQSHHKVDLHYFQKRVGKTLLKPLPTGNLQLPTTPTSTPLLIGLRYIQQLLYQSKLQDLIQQICDPKLSLHFNQGVDKELQAYNHDDTMKGLLNAAVRRMDALKEEQCAFTRYEINQIVVAVVNIHPILEFAIVGFVRGTAMKRVVGGEGGYRYMLMGNQEKLLGDYSANLRGFTYTIIADALGLDLTIQYPGDQEKHISLKPLFPIHIICDKSGKTTLKYQQHLTHSQSVPQQKHYHIDLGRLRGSRQNSNAHTDSRASIGSNDINGSQTSRTKPSKTCPHCGKIKTQRFCECRKTSTPKNSQKGSSALKSGEVKSSNLLNIINKLRKCKKCKTAKQLFMQDEYCGECIGVYNIRRCTGCNELYETVCGKCGKCRWPA